MGAQGVQGAGQDAGGFVAIGLQRVRYKGAVLVDVRRDGLAAGLRGLEVLQQKVAFIIVQMGGREHDGSASAQHAAPGAVNGQHLARAQLGVVVQHAAQDVGGQLGLDEEAEALIVGELAQNDVLVRLGHAAS